MNSINRFLCLIILCMPMSVLYGADPAEPDISLEQHQERAKNGDPQSQIYLMFAYGLGLSVPRDYQKALYWCHEVGKKYPNFPEELHSFSNSLVPDDPSMKAQKLVDVLVLFEKQLGPSSEELTFAAWMQAAILGNMDAQCVIAHRYEHGRGIKADKELAYKWYVKSARQENGYAQYAVGIFVNKGLGGAACDPIKAVEWFKKAINNQNGEAHRELAISYELGHGTPKNNQLALEHYQAAAELGDSRAQQKLADIYYMGTLGASKNYVSSLEWATKAMNQGDIVAMFIVGEIYFYGHVGAADKKSGYELWLKVAQAGDAVAQYNVARCLRIGDGVGANTREAVTWFQKAAQQKHPEAMATLADCYVMGIEVPIDLHEALSLFNAAYPLIKDENHKKMVSEKIAQLKMAILLAQIKST